MGLDVFEERSYVCIKIDGECNWAFSCDDVCLLKETMETMAIMEPQATKGPKVIKETKVIWGHEGSGGSMAPKERRATQGFHQNCR